MGIVQEVAFNTLTWKKKDAFHWIHKHSIDYTSYKKELGRHIFTVFEKNYKASIHEFYCGGGIMITLNYYKYPTKHFK